MEIIDRLTKFNYSASVFFSHKIFKYGFLPIALLFFFTSSVFAQNVDFSPVIEEVRSGFNYQGKKVVKEDKDLIYFKSSIKVKRALAVFYLQEKSNKNVLLNITFLPSQTSEEKVLSDIKKSTGVKLEPIKNNIKSINSYLIKENGITIGSMNYSYNGSIHVLQFYRFPGAEIYKSIQKISYIVTAKFIDGYKGKQTSKDLPIYKSSYTALEAKRSFFVEKNKENFLYSEYEGIEPYVWLAAFGKDLELFKKAGFTNIKLIQENNNKTVVWVFFAKKDNSDYIIELRGDLYFSIAEKLQSTVPHGMKQYTVPREHIVKSANYIKGLTATIIDIDKIIKQSGKLSQKGSKEEAQEKMKSAVWEISSLRSGPLASMSNEIEKAKKAASKYNCSKTVKSIKKFDKAIRYLRYASKKFKENTENFIHARPDEYKNTVDGMVESFNKLLKEAKQMESLYSSGSSFELCLVPKDSVAKKS